MTEKQNITASFTDATWNDPNHKSFRVIVTLSNGDVYPFTYLIDGSDDNDGIISVSVKNAYNNGELDIAEFPENEEDHEHSHKKSEIIHRRNLLLSESDYLMMVDYPISDEKKQEIRVYRQALRDITQQDGFPDSIVWPDKPVI